MNKYDFELLVNGAIEHLQEMETVYVGDLKMGELHKLKFELTKQGYNTYYDQNDQKLKLRRIQKL